MNTEGFGTLAVHGSRAEDVVNAPATTAIYQTASWEFESLAQARAIFDGVEAGATYGTRGGPNHRGLEALATALEGAEAAYATSSGMTAIMTSLLCLLGPGDRLVTSLDLFGVTDALLRLLERWGIATERVDFGDSNAVRNAIATGPRVVLVETISNPLVRVPDLRMLSDLCTLHASKLVVDNTFAGPYHCRPLDHGAALVIESTTKSFSGHHNVVGGVIAGSRKLIDDISSVGRLTGAPPSPFDAWLVARGSATLHLRAQRAAENTMAVARFLQDSARIKMVHYPGLASHADYAVASRVLTNGFGAVLSFELAANDDQIERFLRGLRNIRLVHTLGGVATTLSHAVTMTHRLVSPEQRLARGIHEGLFRLAVGIEDLADITDDLARGLEMM